jgi:hypothetical protein
VGCHTDVLTRTSRQPNIASFHPRHIEVFLGLGGDGGVDAELCIRCHPSVNLLSRSSITLRKTVDPGLCAICHGPGSTRPFYP